MKPQSVATRYRIEITSDVPTDASATFIVDVSSSQIRLEEIRVQIGSDGAGLPTGLSKFDFEALVAAAVSMSEGAFPSPALTGAQPTRANRRETSPRAITATANALTRVSVPTAASGRAGSGRSAAGTPSDLPTVYWRLGGSIVKVAKHYDVPRQIANDWVKDLRGRNTIPTPRLSSKRGSLGVGGAAKKR